MTQDLFVKLQDKNRWQFYLDSGHDDERIEREIHFYEIPNILSKLSRERHPESYRICRRVTALLQHDKRFQYYASPVYEPEAWHTSRLRRADANPKLMLRVYGLSTWPLDKSVKSSRPFPDMIRDVHFRMRNIKRTGRANISQLIISNSELGRLMVEIFNAIDSPTDVRTIRLLVLSKVAVEDLVFVPMDFVAPTDGQDESDYSQAEFADERATPEEDLLNKEAQRHVVFAVEELLESIKKKVRCKPKRYSKLLKVTWYCYFDSESPTQGRIAKRMGISDSLVSYYRKVFDTTIQRLNLNYEEWVQLNGALEIRLLALLNKAGSTEDSELSYEGRPQLPKRVQGELQLTLRPRGTRTAVDT
jgi:hypothetical protein